MAENKHRKPRNMTLWPNILMYLRPNIYSRKLHRKPSKLAGNQNLTGWTTSISSGKNVISTYQQFCNQIMWYSTECIPVLYYTQWRHSVGEILHQLKTVLHPNISGLSTILLVVHKLISWCIQQTHLGRQAIGCQRPHLLPQHQDLAQTHTVSFQKRARTPRQHARNSWNFLGNHQKFWVCPWFYEWKTYWDLDVINMANGSLNLVYITY